MMFHSSHPSLEWCFGRKIFKDAQLKDVFLGTSSSNRLDGALTETSSHDHDYYSHVLEDGLLGKDKVYYLK